MGEGGRVGKKGGLGERKGTQKEKAIGEKVLLLLW